MEFDTKSKIAGGASAILTDSNVASVFSAFGDGYLNCYGRDIRTMRNIMNSVTLRQVRSFVNQYGVDDGVKIIDRLFGETYRGKYQGDVIGSEIFSSHKKWLADKLLLEAISNDNEMGTLWNKW